MRRPIAIIVVAAALTCCAAWTAWARPASPSSDDNSCHSPFGTLCGNALLRQYLAPSTDPALVHKGPMRVAAYSNCNGETITNKNYNISIDAIFSAGPNYTVQYRACSTTLVTGMQFQCVEFARRAWLLQFGVQFQSVDYAVDIFAIKTAKRFTVRRVAPMTGACAEQTVPILTYKNNATNKPPLVGDLLVYDTTGPGMQPTGHVCVVVGVDLPRGTVSVSEQNWANAPWPAPARNYSRTLKLTATQGAWAPIIELHDPPYSIMGWKRVRHAPLV